MLKLSNPDYVPEPWTPVNTLTWAKAMAWDLRGNIDEEIARSILLKTLKPAQVAQLFPPYPADHPYIVPGFKIGAASPAPADRRPDAVADDQARTLNSVRTNFSALDTLLGPAGSGIGSNSWVIAGSRSATGKPILANDPHLGIQMPSIWFQIGLHLRKPAGGSGSAAASYDVAGFSFAGVPGVIIGHNDRIAWGFTNVGPDVMDLYVEKTNPANPDQYEVNGAWVGMTTRSETIKVAGGKPITLTVRATRHGPIVSDLYLPRNFRERAGIGMPEHYAVALRWTALEPNHLFEAIWAFDKARGWSDFREAARSFTVPAQNLVYADVDGNIGYQMPGKVPIRARGDGRLPVPGWTDDYEWKSYIPFEKLPYSFNPPSGYIVTANNAVVGPDYPYLITEDWDYGFRAKRIADMITGSAGPLDIARIQKMQFDDLNANAQALLPALGELSAAWKTPTEIAAAAMLKDWDLRNDASSKGAMIFEEFWWFLLKDGFANKLPKEYRPGGGARWYEVVRELLRDPTNPWWDDPSTAIVEKRDDILAEAFIDAVRSLQASYGPDPAKWPAWGDLHTATFKNQTLGQSGIRPIEALFNRGPFRTSGGDALVNATGWRALVSFEVNWLPSMRMIVDLSDLKRSVTVHTTGESGHAFARHYIDLAPLWASGRYYSMLWDEKDVEAEAEAHLRMRP